MESIKNNIYGYWKNFNGADEFHYYFGKNNKGQLKQIVDHLLEDFKWDIQSKTNGYIIIQNQNIPMSLLLFENPQILILKPLNAKEIILRRFVLPIGTFPLGK